MKVLTYYWGVNLYVTSPSDDSQRTTGQCGNNNNNAGDEPGNDWPRYRYAHSDNGRSHNYNKNTNNNIKNNNTKLTIIIIIIIIIIIMKMKIIIITSNNYNNSNNNNNENKNRLYVTLSLPRVINIKFPLQPHQKYYITQYGQLGYSYLTQMKDDYTTNPQYLTHTFVFKRLGECTLFNLGVKGKRVTQFQD